MDYLSSTWASMIQRCTNPRSTAYRNYGERGIKVCARWRIFKNFKVDILSEIGERPLGKTLDRIDNDGNYCPGNIRWATRKEQQNNKRESQNYTYKRPSAPRKDNKTGKPGVYWNKRMGRYQVWFTLRKHRLYLGAFISLDAAIRVREMSEHTFKANQ